MEENKENLSSNKKSTKKLFITIIAIIVLTALCVVGYTVLNKNTQDNNPKPVDDNEKIIEKKYEIKSEFIYDKSIESLTKESITPIKQIIISNLEEKSIKVDDKLTIYLMKDTSNKSESIYIDALFENQLLNMCNRDNKTIECYKFYVADEVNVESYNTKISIYEINGSYLVYIDKMLGYMSGSTLLFIHQDNSYEEIQPNYENKHMTSIQRFNGDGVNSFIRLILTENPECDDCSYKPSTFTYYIYEK